MQHHYPVEAVDRTCRDILERPHVPFGGITIAWGGDFQQTLLVVPRGTKEEIIGACIQSSYLWHHTKVLHLIKTMRLDDPNLENALFGQWLVNIGQGKNLPLDHSFTIPQHMICGPDLPSLLSATYPWLENGEPISDQFFLEHTILCPRNSEVNEINALVLD